MKAQVARELQQAIIAKAKTPRLADTLEFVVVTARSDWLNGEFVGCLKDCVVGAQRCPARGFIDFNDRITDDMSGALLGCCRIQPLPIQLCLYRLPLKSVETEEMGIGLFLCSSGNHSNPAPSSPFKSRIESRNCDKCVIGFLHASVASSNVRKWVAPIHQRSDGAAFPNILNLSRR